MALAIATIEGTVDHSVDYHYDVTSDVLYLSLLGTLERETYGDETPDGLIIMRDMETDEIVGMTIISYWKLSGQKALPSVTLRDLEDALVATAHDFRAKLLDVAESLAPA